MVGFGGGALRIEIGAVAIDHAAMNASPRGEMIIHGLMDG
jgi:hypothetical protein